MNDFALTFLVIGAAILVLPHVDRKDDRVRSALFAGCILLTWRYVSWRFATTLPPLAWRLDSLYPWAFATIEALANLGWTIGFVTLSRTSDRGLEVREQQDWLKRLARVPRVDVLIPTYNEDESILTRTIIGALNIDFPAARVWVLDDGRRPWLEQLCASKGVHYLERPDNRHAKAGNINYALDVLRNEPDPPDFVAIFDADFVPRREFLCRTMPLFHDPRVGLVQTPQHFFNKDPIQSNLLLGNVWPDEQRFFFDQIMPSKDAWGAALCCGTSSVIRIRALEEIGGVPIESVTEDFLLTLEFDRKGWRTVYLNERLSAGLAPEGIKEYITQRSRWCIGLMQILRSPLGPLSRGRLSLAYRVGLIDAFLYWGASFPFKLLCLLAPIVFWFTGLTVGAAPAGEVISHFLPYYTAIMISLYWVTGGFVQPVLTDVAHILTMPTALSATFVGLLNPHGRPYKVTAKGSLRSRVVIQWPMIGRFGVLAGLTVAGMLYGSLADFTPERQGADVNAIILFWSAYNVMVLLLAMSVCVELPRYRREERFATSELVRVSAGDRTFTAPLADISVLGTRVLAPMPGQVQDVISLRVDHVGDIAARIVYGSDKDFAVNFIDADGQHDAFIRKVFSGRYDQHFHEVRWRGLFGALFARILR
jgi:cellulose synthase (UDP-forming)